MKEVTEYKRPGLLKRTIAAALVDWLGVPVSPSTSDFWAAWATPINSAGQTVSEQTVLSLSAAWACTRLLAETCSTLPLNLYERTDQGRRLATEHPLYPIIHRSPNAYSSANTYWESKFAASILKGNAYSERRYIGNRLVALDFLEPWRLTSQRQPDGTYNLLYREDDGRQRTVEERNLFHVPGFSLGGKYGVSVIAYGAGVFGSALASNAAANGTFERGLMPTVGFSLDIVLNERQRDEFRKNFEEKIAGAVMAGKPALLEGGMKAEPIGINPTDAQLLESRQFSVEEVCRWFRVDPSMVGHGNKDSNWGTGLEQKLIGFLTFTLRSWLTRFEQAINRQLLSPLDRQRYYAEFSIEGLLRADSPARAAFYSVMVNNGIFTRDEVRRLENLPLMGGNAAVLTVQSAMAPLDSLGQQTDGDTARAALANWLNAVDNGDTESANNVTV